MVGYKGRLDWPFNDTNLLIIPWQTKAQRKAAVAATATGLTSPTIINADNGSLTKPMHAVLFFDLMTTATSVGSKRPVVITHCSAVPHSKALWAGYLAKEPRRFCVNIRGRGKEVYAPIRRGNLDKNFSKLFDRALSTVCRSDTMEETIDTWEGKTSNFVLL